MIPFLDLKKINEPYETAFQEKLKMVLNNGWYILGKKWKRLKRLSPNIIKRNIALE